MDKKTLTTILITAAVLLVMYYIYSRKNNGKSSSSDTDEGTAGNSVRNSSTSYNSSTGNSSNSGGSTGAGNGSSLNTAYYQSLTESEKAYLREEKRMVGRVLNRTVDYYGDEDRCPDEYGNIQKSYERALVNYHDDMSAYQQNWMRSHCPNFEPLKKFVVDNWSAMRGNYESDTKRYLGV